MSYFFNNLYIISIYVVQVESFMKLYFKVLKQYGDFKTRSTTKEFWVFNIFSIIITLVLTVIDSYLDFKILVNINFLNALYLIFIFTPSIAVSVRRLHDVGKSGWSILFILIPIIGAIWLLALFCRDTMPERNKWGANPTLRVVL